MIQDLNKYENTLSCAHMKYETISLCFLYENIKNIMKILKCDVFVYIATIIDNNTYLIS